MKIGKTDTRDTFDLRLEGLDKVRHAHESEKQAAINVYERLTTAKSIVTAIFPGSTIETALLISVFEALGPETELLKLEDKD